MRHAPASLSLPHFFIRALQDAQIIKMTTFETLTILIATLAVAVPFYYWSRTNKAQSQPGKADLLSNHIDPLSDIKRPKSTAKIDMELAKYATGHRLVITNTGEFIASDVSFDFGGLPLIENDYKRMIPIPELRPGKSIRMVALKSKRLTEPYFKVTVTCQNPDDTKGEDDLVLHWPGD